MKVVFAILKYELVSKRDCLKMIQFQYPMHVNVKLVFENIQPQGLDKHMSRELILLDPKVQTFYMGHLFISITFPCARKSDTRELN